MADDRISNQPIPPTPPRRSTPRSTEPDDLDELPSLPRGGSGGGLSSLAQAAREKQLRSARTTMIVVGVLTVVANIVIYFISMNQFDAEVRKVGLDRNNLPADVKAALMIDYLVMGGFTALGLVFIILGVLVPKYPVPCTVTGLVLYIAGWGISGVADPKNLAAGVIIKIVIVVVLVKAVQAAMAYEREKAAAAD